MASTSPSSGATLYFGYGSNLWRSQMLKRCPNSTFIGIGRLDNYTWLINDRGYANVVPSTSSNPSISSSSDQVWGLIYTLTTSDEAALDRNEGVPYCYEKELHKVRLWSAKNISSKTEEERGRLGEGDGDGLMEEMLVYIDHERTSPARPKQEYIYRMNRGVEDALEVGVPKEYVDDVIRKFIPAPSSTTHDPAMESLAKKQAQSFEDEE